MKNFIHKPIACLLAIFLMVSVSSAVVLAITEVTDGDNNASAANADSGANAEGVNSGANAAGVNSDASAAGVNSGANANGVDKYRAEYIFDERGGIPGVNVKIRDAETLSGFANRARLATYSDAVKAEAAESFAYRYIEDDTDKGEEEKMENVGPNYSMMWDNELSEFFNDDYYLERMKELGFYLSDDSNDSSLNYRNAVIRLQSSINQSITGTLTLQAKKALIEGGGVVAYDLVESPPSSEYWVTINKSTRILTVYSGDKIHKKYPVAVGSSMSLTPDGKFTFVTKAVNPAWGGGGYAKPVAGGVPSNPLGPRWMGLSIGGGGRYGVHGNASPRSIGTYASHGCVRMINADVRQLYDYIPVGTNVWVGTTEKLNSYGVYQNLIDPLAGDAPPPEPEPEPEPVREDLALMIELE